MTQDSTRQRLAKAADIAPEDRFAAAVVSLVVYLAAGASLAVVAGIPAIAHGHRGLLWLIAAIAMSSAAITFPLLRSPRTPVWALHINQLLALSMIPAIVALTGGASSPLWFWVICAAFFTSIFYGRPLAVFYLALCVIEQALPLAYDSAATHGAYLGELLCAAPAYVAFCLAVNSGKRRSTALRARAETQAAEQAALRRVASSVADGDSSERIFAMVAAEAGTLLGGNAAAIMRVEGDGDRLMIVGRWATEPSAAMRVGALVPLGTGTIAAQTIADGQPRRTAQHRTDDPADRLGHRSSVIAPVRVGERVWGILAVASSVSDRFDADDERTLAELGALLATSVSSAEARVRLAEQALSDPLTGLANQRALRGRLEAELARGGRRGSSVAVAMIDIDHFKEINDTAGHETGDEMLQRVASALRGFARVEDTVARVGGDEFAWLMPDTRREQALVAVERARQLIASAPADPYRITISAGICDTDSSEDPQELLRLADSALYWSKEHGRNQAWIYDPSIVHDLTERQRALRIERSQALEGLRALIRAREGGDSARSGHTERVAAAAVSLALALDWRRDHVMLLNEAASLHDVGRVAGVIAPALDAGAGIGAAELERLHEAAAAGADMLDGLLEDEQLAWIRGVYEPVAGGSVVDGAAILTVADAYDLMTAVTPGGPDEALEELDRLAESTLVDPRVVDALRELLAGGGIGQPDVLR